jgi:hypothetical protein
MSHNKIRKDILKRKINILLTEYGNEEGGMFISGPDYKHIVDDVLTNELAQFVFETTGNELHYLNHKCITDYDKYDVSNFVSIIHKHCRISMILNGGII